MDRWKSRGGNSQRREKQKREDQRRERVRRKKMQVREKVGKLRNTVFFQWFEAPEGRKVGSLKRRVRSHLARWTRKNCTPLWREARLEVTTRKTLQNTMFGPLLEVEMSKKCTPLWHEASFQVKMLKTPHAWTTFEGSDVVSCGRRKGFCTLPKVSKTWRFCSSFKSVGRRGTFEEDLERCMSRGRCRTRDMLIRDVRRSGRCFPERVAFWSI